MVKCHVFSLIIFSHAFITGPCWVSAASLQATETQTLLSRILHFSPSISLCCDKQREHGVRFGCRRIVVKMFTNLLHRRPGWLTLRPAPAKKNSQLLASTSHCPFASTPKTFEKPLALIPCVIYKRQQRFHTRGRNRWTNNLLNKLQHLMLSVGGLIQNIKPSFLSESVWFPSLRWGDSDGKGGRRVKASLLPCEAVCTVLEKRS